MAPEDNRKLLVWFFWTVFVIAAVIIAVASWRPQSLFHRKIVAGLFFVLGGGFAGMGEGMLMIHGVDPSGDRTPGSDTAATFAIMFLPLLMLYALAQGLVPLIGYDAPTGLFTSLAVLSFFGSAMVTYMVNR